MSFPAYDEYKDSGIHWLGEVPMHWGVVRLRHVTELNPSKGEVSDLDRELPVSFLPMEAIGDDGTIKLEHTRSIGVVENGYTYFREGDVTLAKITPCFENGKGAIMRGLLNGIGFGTTELIVVRPRPEHTTSDYLHWLFMSSYFRRIGESTMYGAGGQKRISDHFVRNFATAIPPLDEQQAISSFLDFETSKIDGLMSEQRRLIELLKEKRQAVISHAVTKGLNPNAPMKPSGIQWLGDVPEHWELKPLKFIGQIISGFAFKSHTFTDAGVRVLKIANIQTFNLDWSDESFVPESFYKEHQSFAVLEGDIVFALTRPIISTGLKAAIADVGKVPVLLNQRNAIFRPTIDLDKHFFYHVLFSDSFRIDFENKIDFTGQQPNISPLDIADIKIPFPPKDEQVQIGTHLDDEVEKFSQLQAEAERAIELLQERRTALISAAVTGKIDVRGFDFSSSTAR